MKKKVNDNNKRYKIFWRRTFAIFLDGAAMAPLMWLDQVLWNIGTGPLSLFLWVILSSIIAICYSVGFVYVFGQTFGKMATGIVVVSNDNAKLKLRQAILRHIVPVIFTLATIVFVTANLTDGKIYNRGFGNNLQFFIWFGSAALIWGLLEILTMLTNRKRRAVHDFIAGTVVIKQIPCNRISGHRKILWTLIILFILNMIIPNFLPEERNLTFTTISGKRQMESKLKKNSNCISINKITNQYDPVDLMITMKSCINSKEYNKAAENLFLAKIFGMFDASRISDKTAGQAVVVLQINIMSNVDKDQRQEFQKVINNEFSKGSDGLKNLCKSFNKIGYPIYYPIYMISHGMHGGGLVDDFDAKSRWEELLSINCDNK
jgi:uncharacterized RDD family membrane protein YckC